MQRRRLLGLFGLGLVLLAVLAAGVGDERGPVAALVAALGNDYLVVVLLGVPAAVLAAALFAVSRPGSVHRAPVPEPERPAGAPVAGSGFDELLGDWRLWLPLSGRGRRAVVHHRLRAATVRTVQRVEKCSREEAERLVERGDWTEEGSVAAFVASEDAPSPGPFVAVGTLLRGDPWFGSRARATVDELVAYDEGVGPGPTVGGRVGTDAAATGGEGTA